MRLLVGTLYTIESEFEDCCTAIKQQTYRNFNHTVIRNLPKHQAHHALYGMFMQRSDEFDLLVKVDADMVIEDRDLFKKIVDRFASDPDLDLLLIAVHDFFTDKLVMGMNVFRNTVQWSLGEERLFTDRVYLEGSIRKMVKDYSELAPAAVHCRNPSPFQAFHYGFHRGMKAVQGGRNWKNLRSLFEHYRRTRDQRIAYAMLGANAAFTNRFSVEHVSYNDDTIANYFSQRFDGRSADELHRAVRRSKMYWLFKLPIDRRIVTKYYRLKARIL